MSDLSVTSGSVLASSNATTANVTAGETITAGQAVYRKTADGLYYKADSNSGTSEAQTPTGIALNGASAGQPLKIAMEDSDFTPGATITEGELYVLSGTAGGIAPVADLVTGMKVSAIGVGKATNKLALKIVTGGTVQ